MLCPAWAARKDELSGLLICRAATRVLSQLPILLPLIATTTTTSLEIVPAPGHLVPSRILVNEMNHKTYSVAIQTPSKSTVFQAFLENNSSKPTALPEFTFCNLSKTIIIAVQLNLHSYEIIKINRIWQLNYCPVRIKYGVHFRSCLGNKILKCSHFRPTCKINSKIV